MENDSYAAMSIARGGAIAAFMLAVSERQAVDVFFGTRMNSWERGVEPYRHTDINGQPTNVLRYSFEFWLNHNPKANIILAVDVITPLDSDVLPEQRTVQGLWQGVKFLEYLWDGRTTPTQARHKFEEVFLNVDFLIGLLKLTSEDISSVA